MSKLLLSNFQALADRSGLEPIGAGQATIAFTAIADLGGGRVRATTSAPHNLKKGQCVYTPAAAYAGVYRVLRVHSPTQFDFKATFAGTTANNFTKTAWLDGRGFRVTAVPVTIAEFEPLEPGESATSLIARSLNLGDEILIRFNKIRITAGNLDVIRGFDRAPLSYTNR